MAAALALGTSAPLELAERETLDVRFAVRGTQPVDGLAVVAIDERTFSELSPTWPFRRRLHARVLDRLREAGAGQVVYDVQFTEPSDRPDDDLALYDAVARTGHVILATGESDGHGRHARARRRGAARARRAARSPPPARSRTTRAA